MEDIKEKEQLRKKLSENQAMNDIIIEITNLEKKKAKKYFDSITDLTNSLIEIIAESSLEKEKEKEKDSVLRFFRITHTIKGNARTFGFNLLSHAVHNLESANQISDELTLEKISNTEECSLYLRQYECYKNVFMRVFGDKESGTEATLSNEKIKQLIKICSLFPHDNKGLYYQSQALLSDLLDQLYPSTKSIKDYVSTIVSQTAKELGNQVPTLYFNASEKVYFKENDFLAVTSFLGHMIRNSVDHGIGSKENGSINIDIEFSSQAIEIILSDNGDGINIDGIRKKIEPSGTNAKEITDKEVALTIFQSGFSTKEQLSNISGKGIGMNAVANNIKELGGRIDMEFIGDKIEGKRRFNFRIHLPKSLVLHNQKLDRACELKTGT